MKKVVIVFWLLMITFSSFAQGFHLEVLAGLNQSTFTVKSDQITSPTAVTGFHIGIFSEFKRDDNFSIEPGLVFASIGGKYNYNQSSPYSSSSCTTKNTVQYLQVPLNFIYNIHAALGKVFFGGGPYIGFGVSGKIYQTGTDYSYTVSGGNIYSTPTNINTATNYTFSKYDNPDYGLNAVAGVRFKNRFIVTLGYGYGLKSTSDAYATQINVARLSLGYAFY